MSSRARLTAVLSGLLVLAVTLVATAPEAAAGVKKDRQGIIDNEIRKAKDASQRASEASQEARGARGEANGAGQEAEEARQNANKVKTPEGRAAAEQEAKVAKEKAEKAKEATQKTKKEAEGAEQKAGEEADKKVKEAEGEVKEAEKEAAEAMKSGNVAEMERKLKELEEARAAKKKAEKEAEKAKKKAEEEAEEAVSAAEGEQKAAEEEAKEAEENADPEETEKKAKDAEKEAREAEEKARKAEAKAKKAREEAAKAKKAAEEAVKKFKKKYGKPKDRKLDDALRDIAYSQIPEQRRTSCTFVSLAGETAVNPDFFGEKVTCTFYAEDGTELDQEDVAEISEAPDGSIIVDVLSTKVAKFAVMGTLGTALFLSGGDDQAAEPEPGGLVTRDGDIRINPDGTIGETVNLADDISLADVSHNTFTVNDTLVDWVAARENEAVIYGDGFAPMDTIGSNGTITIAWEKPDGTVVRQDVTCWAGNIFVSPITHVGVPAEIELDLRGVPSNQEITITFITGPGQTITPSVVKGLAGDLTGAIAEITVDRAGPQRVDAVITRGNLAPRDYKNPDAMTRDEISRVVQDMDLEYGARLLGKAVGRPIGARSQYGKQMYEMYQSKMR